MPCIAVSCVFSGPFTFPDVVNNDKFNNLKYKRLSRITVEHNSNLELQLKLDPDHKASVYLFITVFFSRLRTVA